jgi:hypothetical protein
MAGDHPNAGCQGQAEAPPCRFRLASHSGDWCCWAAQNPVAAAVRPTVPLTSPETCRRCEMRSVAKQGAAA